MSHALHYNTIHERIERSRERQVPQDINVRQLDDIEVSRDEATPESAKLFWQTYARRHLK